MSEPYKDQAKIDRVLTFIRHLTHTKGAWAGQQFSLLPWQTDEIIEPLFGTINGNGRRQYRICFCEVPKKNGKTELGAALCLYALCADEEASPEVYSAAADRDQASLVYHVAAQMVRNSPKLSKYLRVRDSQRRIMNPRNGGYYRVLSSEVATKHGLNPSFICFDEIHAQPNDELWRVLTSGTDYAREQQLIFVITTAGIYDIESIWWRVRQKARQVKSGVIEDPSFLPVLYIADPEKDDPEDEELWRRVNPSLGRIFDMDRIRRDYAQAKTDSIEWEDFKRYRLNIPSKQVDRWLPMDEWDRGARPIDPMELMGRPCYGGVDLASTTDLSAFALVFPPLKEDEDWLVLVKAYCPEGTMRKRVRQERISYDRWARTGDVVITPGNATDYGFIKKDVLEADKIWDIREIGYDPWNATEFSLDLYNGYGLPLVEVRQGPRTLSEPAKLILKTVLAGRVRHAGNPVLRWACDNLVMVPDPNENIRPAKDKSTDRIDPFVAVLIAWSRAMANLSTLISVYEDRGIMSLT